MSIDNSGMSGNVVWLLTTGSREDYGDYWDVVSIHRTKDGAKNAKRIYEIPILNEDGSEYIPEANDIEQWQIAL